MIKKAIAGLLGVVISSVMITSDYYIEKQTSDFNDVSKTLESTNSQAKVKGSNSVGKYIENVSLEQEEICAQPLNMKANSENYHVLELDFDIETGKLSVVSTQTTECTMKLEFINDDNSDDIDVLKESVKAGERIETTIMVDTGMLPQFFQVRCVLTDVHGDELGEPFVLSKYMRFMQELDVATVDDYAEQYVVNLDESEDTNFFVLSEDTIVAESSEEENTLVSADYDNEVYVFEHINDSIRYLSEGDFFYAQPNDMDMVAVNIESIEIDGDTAIIRGGGEIDDMFDVIKLDVNHDSIDYSNLENDDELENFMNITSSDNDNNDYSVEYNGTVMDESGEYAIDYSVVSYGSMNTPVALADDSSITAVEIPLEYEFKPRKNDIGESFNKYSYKNSDTNFTDKAARSYELSAEVTAKLSLKIGIDLTFRKKKKDSDFGIDASFKAGVKVEGTAKAEFSFALDALPPLNFGIFFFDFEPCIKFGVKGSVTVQQEMTFVFTLHSIKEDGKRTLIHDHDFSKGINNATNKFELEGDFYIEFVPKVLVYPFGCKKLLFCSCSIPVKFNAKVSLFKAENNSGDLQDGTFSSSLVNSKENALHLCSLCYRIEPSISFNVESELKIPFCEKQKIKFFKKEWKLSPWHYSSTFSEIKKGECEHYAYATDLHVIGTEDIDAAGLVVDVDGTKITTDGYGDAYFYLDPKKNHTYKVYSNDKVIKSGSFSNKAEYITFNIDLNDGSTVIASSSPIVTTAPYTEPPEPHTVTSAIATIRETSPDDIIVEGGPLGDNVFYSLYPDGLLHIFGYGTMDTSYTTIKNKSLVKNVLIEDQATFIKDEIETENTNEILIEEFTEKNQKELCAKYLENNKDDIIKVLNEEYYVEIDDPNLDEMINDYIYANSEEIAREYYDNHENEYADALLEFKKSLLTELGDKVITNIGNGLFNGCTNLELITYEGSPNEGKKAFDLPDTIVSIDDNAFNGCSNLKFGDIVFSDKLEKIGNYAFQDCTGITAITVPGSVKEIGIKAFMGCTNLKKAVFKEGIEDIGWGTLAGCESLEDLTLPFAGINLEAVESEERKIDKEGSIGTKIVHIFLDNKNKYTFKYSTKLKNVTITGGTRIPPYTLYYGDDEGGWNYNYNPITNVFLSDSVKYIESHAFYHCNNLEQINLPSHLEHIGVSAFGDCVKMTLSNSELPSSLKHIGNNAFYGCENLTLSNSELPSNLEYIGKNAFQNCTSLTEELIVPGSVETIGDDAFKGCTSIKKAVFKDGVVSIGNGALTNCSSLEELTLPYAAQSLDALENNKYTLRQLFIDTSTSNFLGNNIKKLTITGGSMIPNNGLSGMSKVTEVILPSSIKTIGNYAFKECTGLTYIYFYDTLEHVGFAAFRDCTAIEEVGYSGSDEQWNNIVIEKDNDPILRKVSYNAPAPNKTEEHIYGDTNGDGQIDMSDAVLIMQALANPNKYGVNGTDPRHISADGFKYGDADGNGLTVNDALRIQQYLLGTIDSLVA